MHALLVTAYKDFPALERLVKKSDPRFFVIFIHIDIQSSINGKQIDRLRELGCLVSRIYKIRWGEINHLYAILHLLGQALKRSDIEYIHLISGEDYPLGTLEDFRIKCDGRIFMGFEVLSAAPQDIRDRYQFYNIFYFLLGKWRILNPIYRLLNSISLATQRKLGVSRRSVGPFRELYKGIIWMSFPFDAGRRIIHDDISKVFLKSARTTYLPEEIYLQTFFLNSDLRSLVVNEDLRFTDWSPRNGIVPAYLDETDAVLILNSKALFARKMSSVLSSRLLDKIDTALVAKR